MELVVAGESLITLGGSRGRKVEQIGVVGAHLDTKLMAPEKNLAADEGKQWFVGEVDNGEGSLSVLQQLSYA